MSTLDFDEDGLAPERSQASSVLGVRNALSPSGRNAVAKTPTTENRASLAHSSGPLARLSQLQARHTALLDGIESAQRSAERVSASIRVLLRGCVMDPESCYCASSWSAARPDMRGEGRAGRCCGGQSQSCHGAGGSRSAKTCQVNGLDLSDLAVPSSFLDITEYFHESCSLKAEYETTSELLSRCAEGLEAQHSALALAEQATEQAQRGTVAAERREQEVQQRAEQLELEIAAILARLEEARAREGHEIEEATKRRQKLEDELEEAQEKVRRIACCECLSIL